MPFSRRLRDNVSRKPMPNGGRWRATCASRQAQFKKRPDCDRCLPWPELYLRAADCWWCLLAAICPLLAVSAGCCLPAAGGVCLLYPRPA